MHWIFVVYPDGNGIIVFFKKIDVNLVLGIVPSIIEKNTDAFTTFLTQSRTKLTLWPAGTPRVKGIY